MRRPFFILTATAVMLASLAGSVAEAAQTPSMPQMPQIPTGGLAAPGLPFKDILARASDQALDKLSKPGAFASDSSVRITLPGPAGDLGGVMAMAGKAGVGGDLSDSLNAAAGQAAGAAKPIFHSAIQNMTLKDAGGLAGTTGATDYLRKSAGGEIKGKITPLVRAALEQAGVLAQASKLGELGMNADSLTDYVAQKTSDGIFTYMGREEKGLRQNPSALFQR